MAQLRVAPAQVAELRQVVGLVALPLMAISQSVPNRSRDNKREFRGSLYQDWVQLKASQLAKRVHLSLTQ